MAIFREVQRVRESKVGVVVFTFLFLAIGAIVYAVFKESENSGFKPVLLIPIVFYLFISVFLFSIKLETEINAIGIYYRFFPFHWQTKTIRWEDVNNVEVRTFSMLRYAGGWGIRKLNGKNHAYTVSGNNGILIYLKNGKKILFGTGNPDELKRVIYELSQIRKFSISVVA